MCCRAIFTCDVHSLEAVAFKAFHKGIDLGAAWGSDILATASGLVAFVGKYGSYGKSVFVDHGFGIQTRYAHLSKILVKKGEKVDLGQILGKCIAEIACVSLNKLAFLLTYASIA